jgi:hypothetical protein
MGFSGKTGTSAKALGSLRQYGLIEGIGDKTRISDLALAIIEPESEDERSGAIARAARNPDVFSSVLNRFAERVPQADEPIRAYLIRDLGFQKGSADELIKSLRTSIAFAEANSVQAPTESFTPTQSEEFGVSASALSVGRESASVALAPSQSATIPLSRDCRAELQIYGPLSDKAVINLLRHIQLLAEVWAED